MTQRVVVGAGGTFDEERDDKQRTSDRAAAEEPFRLHDPFYVRLYLGRRGSVRYMTCHQELLDEVGDEIVLLGLRATNSRIV